MKLRPPREDDARAIVEILNAVTQHAWGTSDATEAQVRRELAAPGVEPESNLRIAEEDGRVVGYAAINSTGVEPVRHWSMVRFDPAADRAVGAALLDWVEERAGTGIVRTFAPSTATDLKTAFEHAGMGLVRHSYRMQIDLEHEPATPVWPSGVAVRSFRDGDERAVYETHQETFEDTWEHQREAFDRWSHDLPGADGFDPSLWYLAEADGELAGILLSMPKEGEPGSGLVHILGVRRTWRGRGVGRALLQHAFCEFWRRDYDRVILGVDASSLTGAQRLYEHAGMRIVRQYDIYEKTL